MEDGKYTKLFDTTYRALKNRAELCADLNPPEAIRALVNEDARNIEGVTGLGWLPWVGKNYAAEGMKNKLFIVAESHYRTIPKKPEDENRNWDYLDHSCVRLAETVFNTDLNKKSGKNDNLAYENLFEAINPFSPQGECLNNNPTQKELDNNSEVKQRVFSNAVFMNMCQRCLNPNEGRRPSPTDFVNGWHTWFKVAKFYKPTLCVFDGFSSLHKLDAALNQLRKLKTEGLKVDYIDSAKDEQSDAVLTRRFIIRIDGHPIEAVWILHTSLKGLGGRTFVPKDWRGYLNSCSPYRDWAAEVKKMPISKFAT